MSTLVEVNTEYENEYVYSKIQCDEKHKWRNCKRFLRIDDGSYFMDRKCAEDNGYEIISFDEFKSRYELKTGDTFEHNGFVCEVKEEIKKWYKSENAYVRTEPMRAEGWTEITNKEFIKQLEENAR